jgi:hypothetical protein
MSIKVLNEQQIFMAHLEPSKGLQFWAACSNSESDYLKLKKQLFANETVASLYEKVEAYENSGFNQL